MTTDTTKQEKPSGNVSELDDLLCQDLEKIDRFPVGRAFATKQGDHPVRYGWITGYGVNPSNELVFKCKWAHRDGEQLIHPANVHSVLSDFGA